MARTRNRHLRPKPGKLSDHGSALSDVSPHPKQMKGFGCARNKGRVLHSWEELDEGSELIRRFAIDHRTRPIRSENGGHFEKAILL